MIKPRKSSREIWATLGPALKSHIKEVFEEKQNDSLWGQIVDSNKKQKMQLVNIYLNQSSRSISEHNITQKLKEQQASFRKPRTFLEDQENQDRSQQKKEWEQLAQEFSPNHAQQQSHNNQTFSPIAKILEAVDTCKLGGHENNQIKFICINDTCPYKYHKACAHCVIKLHSKHIEDMKELDQFEDQMEQQQQTAEGLIIKSELLLKKLQQPFEEFFKRLKEELVTLIDDVERRFKDKNVNRISKLIKTEVDFIKTFNQKFEAYKLTDKKYLANLINEESLNIYKQTMNTINDKINQTFNIEELKSLLEMNLIAILGYNQPIAKPHNSQVCQTSRVTSRDSSPARTASFHSQKFLLSPRSPLNVFSQNIPRRIVSNTQQVILVRGINN